MAIDASAASWTLANEGAQVNRYPFQVDFADPGLVIKGGAINGLVSLTEDSTDAYINAGGGSRRGRAACDHPGLADQPALGRDPRRRQLGRLPDQGRWITDLRDDAIEDDDAIGGTISDSLFDGVFSGISLGDGDVDGSDNVVTLDHVLLRSEWFLYRAR